MKGLVAFFALVAPFLIVGRIFWLWHKDCSNDHNSSYTP